MCHDVALSCDPIGPSSTEQRDERVAISAPFEQALRAALAVDPASEPDDPLLTVQQAVAAVQLDENTLHKRIASGELPASHDGQAEAGAAV